MEQPSNMYADAKTWNPFKGCKFDCVYCRPSFQKQSKRQKQLCQDCYNYVPHCHEDRLSKIPSARIIFVCGNADISFCPVPFFKKIIERIRQHNTRSPHKTYYFQSKKPSCFESFLSEFPENVILLTTLETNRDLGYATFSKAPVPSERYRQFKTLDYPRKVVTIEPVMDFDPGIFLRSLLGLRPEYVWLGLNSRPESLTLPEPSPDKLREFIAMLREAGIEIRGKELRGAKVHATNRNRATSAFGRSHTGRCDLRALLVNDRSENPVQLREIPQNGRLDGTFPVVGGHGGGSNYLSTYPNEKWAKTMSARKRKPLSVCRVCH